MKKVPVWAWGLNIVGILANIVLLVINLKAGKPVTWQIICIGIFGLSMIIHVEANKQYQEAEKMNRKSFEDLQ